MKRVCICLFFFFCTTEALHIETHLGCSKEYYDQIMAPIAEKMEFANQRVKDLCEQRRSLEYGQYEKEMNKTSPRKREEVEDLDSFYKKQSLITRYIFNYCLERDSYSVLWEFISDGRLYDCTGFSSQLDKDLIEERLTKASELYSILSSFDSENDDDERYSELNRKFKECEKLNSETNVWKQYSEEKPVTSECSEKSTDEKDSQKLQDTDEEETKSIAESFSDESDIVPETEGEKFIEEKEIDTSFDEDGMDSKPLSSEYEETTSPPSKEEQIADIKHFEQQCIENSRIEEEKAKVQNADNAILAAQELIYFELDDPSLIDMKDIKVSNEQGLRQEASEAVEREFQKKRDIIRAECSAQIRFINGEGFVKDPEPLVMVSGHGLPMKHTVSMEGLLNSDQNRMQRLRQEELQKIGESDLQRVAKMVPFVGDLMDYNYGRISEKECIEHLSVDALTTFAPVGSLAKGMSFSKSLLKKKQPIKQLVIDTQEFTTKMKISEKPLDELRHATINTDFVIANDNTITMSGKVAVGESVGVGRASSSVVGGNSYGGVNANTIGKQYIKDNKGSTLKVAEHSQRKVSTPQEQRNFINQKLEARSWMKTKHKIGGKPAYYSKENDLWYTAVKREKNDIEVWKVSGKRAKHQGAIECKKGSMYEGPKHKDQSFE